MMLPTYLIYCTNTQSQLEQQGRKMYTRECLIQNIIFSNRHWPLFTWYKTNCIWTTTACSFLHSSHTFASFLFSSSFVCNRIFRLLAGYFFFFFSFAIILFSILTFRYSVVYFFYRATELCSLHFTYIAVSRVFNLYMCINALVVNESNWAWFNSKSIERVEIRKKSDFTCDLKSCCATVHI